MRFYIYTLGCKVNTYESEIMKEALLRSGFEESFENKNVDICIINSCTVTNTADHKTLKTIRQAIHYNEKAIIVVVGCLTQVNAHLLDDIEGISIILGNRYKSKIDEYIREFQKNRKKIIQIENLDKAEFECMKLDNFDKTRAFLKIQDGCNNFCSYCVIPYTRGNVRSKKREDILKEVQDLVKEGHHEIVLTGIHTGNYGAEFENYHFSDLLKELVCIKGLKRLRISSIEITELDEEFLKVLKESPILVDHMHIPLQSGSDTILKNMNRKYDTAYFMEKIDQIRAIRPNISITTDVIVGFPKESEKEFLETISTIEKIQFTKLHVFPYSKRIGTKASLMDGQIDEKIKHERVKRLLALSKKLEIAYMEKFIGKEVDFLKEVHKENAVIGHSGNYLLIKININLKEWKDKKTVMIKKVEYPYVIGE